MIPHMVMNKSDYIVELLVVSTPLNEQDVVSTLPDEQVRAADLL